MRWFFIRPRSVHSPEYQLLAAKLRETRQMTKLTQRDLAAKLSKPASYPHKVETGERELNVVELLDYLTALNVDAVQFISEYQVQLISLRNQK